MVGGFPAADKRGGRFLTSNTNITVDKQTVPIGERYIKFKTKQCVHISLADARDRAVTAFGILYDCEFLSNALTISPSHRQVRYRRSS